MGIWSVVSRRPIPVFGTDSFYRGKQPDAPEIISQNDLKHPGNYLLPIMPVRKKFSFDNSVTPEEAARLQEQFAGQVTIKSLDPGSVKTVAGADAAYHAGMCAGAVCVMNMPGLEILEQSHALVPAEFPYIPGLLAFREGRAIIDAFDRISQRPDLCFFNGHGVAHPRRFGLASHLGVALGIPSIGVARGILTGSSGEPWQNIGDTAPIMDKGEVIGMAVRTRNGGAPVFVSVGHLVDLPGAVRYTLSCSREHRLPEPLYCAHRLAEVVIRRVTQRRN